MAALFGPMYWFEASAKVEPVFCVPAFTITKSWGTVGPQALLLLVPSLSLPFSAKTSLKRPLPGASSLLPSTEQARSASEYPAAAGLRVTEKRIQYSLVAPAASSTPSVSV